MKVKEEFFKTYSVSQASTKTIFGMAAGEQIIELELVSDGVRATSKTISGDTETRYSYVLLYNDAKTALGLTAGEEINSVTLAEPILIITRKRNL